MYHIKIRNESIPALGLGTWQLKGQDCIQCVHYALDLGYRHVDTAQIYENEREVGEGIKVSNIARDKIFLTTKVWTDHFEKGDLQESVDESLKRLKTDYVDLLLLHWPNENVPMEDTFDALMKVQDAGKARLIGVSNFTTALLEKARDLTGGRIICNQVEYHPFINQAPVLDWLRGHDMFLTAYSPLARGKVFKNEIIEQIAEEKGKTPAQVTVRWGLQQSRVATIPKSGARDHIQQNFDVFDFELSEEEMRKISSLASESGRLIDPDFAPDWDTAKAA